MTQPPKRDDPPLLADARVLVTEDDFIIAMELGSALRENGAAHVDRCGTVKDALVLALTADLSIAVLDVRLGHERIDPVARLLADREIPFVFYTGQSDLDVIRTEWPECTVVSKPAQSQTIVQALAALLQCNPRSPKR